MGLTHIRGAFLLVVVVALLVGCSVDETRFSDLPGRAELVGDVTPVPEPTPEPTPESRLPEEWYEDSNGDRIPDLVARHLGWDPEGNRCVMTLECGDDDDPDGEIPLREFNTFLLLDASGSMMDDVADGQKMELAKQGLDYYVTGIPETTDLGMLAYGHVGSMDPDDYEGSCAGVEIVGELGEVNHESVGEILEPLSPTGFTPLAAAIEKASEELEVHEDAYNRMVVVSDGRETCEGDPVAAAEEFHEAGLGVVDVLAFDVPEDELPQLEEIAGAGGGDLVIAADGAELREALRSDLSSVHHIGQTQACVVNQSVAMKGCLAAQQTHVTLAFDELLEQGGPDGEPWDDDQREEIVRIRNESELWNIEEQRLVEGESMPSIQALTEALQGASERLSDVYEEDLDELRTSRGGGVETSAVSGVGCPWLDPTVAYSAPG